MRSRSCRGLGRLRPRLFSVGSGMRPRNRCAGSPVDCAERFQENPWCCENEHRISSYVHIIQTLGVQRHYGPSIVPVPNVDELYTVQEVPRCKSARRLRTPYGTTLYVDFFHPPSSMANPTASLENSSMCSKLNSSEMSYLLRGTLKLVQARVHVENYRGSRTHSAYGCTRGSSSGKWPLKTCECDN